jgi:transketolase
MRLMRATFIQELIVQARQRQEIFLVVGDLGFAVVEPFAREFPDRFLNAGVSEQNMTGVAAGLASEGYHVFTYSIANFPTLRCLEQVRNDVCHHHLAVTVVSVGAGFSYGALGYSHFAVQDIGVMRTLPEMTILSPADIGETRECVQWLAQNPCPSYLRLSSAAGLALHGVGGLSHAPLRVANGDGPVAVICTGSILRVALAAAGQLTAQGRPIPVFSCPRLQPTPDGFFECLKPYSRLLVLEEHVATGGLASLLRDNLPRGADVVSVGTATKVLGEVGNQDWLREAAGMTAQALLDLLQA